MNVDKIFISGCAKTGTTLVRRLMNAFKETVVYNRDEIHLTAFVTQNNFNVAKRTSTDIFSNDMPKFLLESQTKLIEDNNVGIIIVTRNKADTLKSDNGWVTEERYNACIKQALDTKLKNIMFVKYEQLVRNPNAVQQAVMRDFDLTLEHKWSDYHIWYKPTEEIEYYKTKENYLVRPIKPKENE